jgi:hypothetical protein
VLGVEFQQAMRTLIVSANLALMLSAVFEPFFGAIAMVFGRVVGRWSRSSLVVWLLRSKESKNCVGAVCVSKSSSAGLAGARVSWVGSTLVLNLGST